MWHKTCKGSSLGTLGLHRHLFSSSLNFCINSRPSWRLGTSTVISLCRGWFLHRTVGSMGHVCSISHLLYSPTELAGVWRKLAWKWRRRNLELFSLNMDGLVCEGWTHSRGWHNGGGVRKSTQKGLVCMHSKTGWLFFNFQSYYLVFFLMKQQC